jgi:REP element-mobilizing transposase RayT
MARPLRITRPGSWYHLTARGNERRTIYRDEGDRQKFLALLENWVERFRMRLHAYVLMDNHYHLLAEALESNLREGMQWLNVSYSMWFNRRHQRVGFCRTPARFRCRSSFPNAKALRRTGFKWIYRLSSRAHTSASSTIPWNRPWNRCLSFKPPCLRPR